MTDNIIILTVIKEILQMEYMRHHMIMYLGMQILMKEEEYI